MNKRLKFLILSLSQRSLFNVCDKNKTAKKNRTDPDLNGMRMMMMMCVLLFMYVDSYHKDMYL